MSQSNIFAADGKILSRARKQKRTRQLGSTLRGHEAHTRALSVYLSVYTSCRARSCLSFSVVKPQSSPAMAGGSGKGVPRLSVRTTLLCHPPMKCPELSSECVSLALWCKALFDPHSLVGTKSHLRDHSSSVHHTSWANQDVARLRLSCTPLPTLQCSHPVPTSPRCQPQMLGIP